MPINESLIGNGVSASAVPAAATSDVIVDSKLVGEIILEAQIPGAANWIRVTNQGGSYAVATPDVAVTYRFRAVNVEVSTPVYFGA